MSGNADALGLIADSIDEVVWLVEWPSLRMIYLSPAFERVWGLEPSDLDPGAWLDVIVESDRHRLFDELPVLVGEERFRMEFRIRRPDGEVRWLRAQCVPIERENGVPTRIAGTTRDITDIRHTSTALAEREAMHKAWMDSARDFVVYRLRARSDTPFQAEIEFVSPSIERVMGVSADAPFEAWFAGIHPDDRTRVESATRIAAENASDFDEEMRFRRSEDEGWRWIRAISTPVHDSDTGTRYANGLIVDITDRMVAAEESRLRSDALEHSLNGFFIADANGRPIYANRMFLDMWGYDNLDEVQGLAPQGLCAVPDVADTLIEMLTENGTDEREFVAKRRDGTVFDVMMVNRIFTDMDNQCFIMGSAIDVTERNRADAALRRAATVFESTAEGMLITDAEGDIVAVNPAFCSMTGYEAHEVIGRNPRLLRSERHGKAFFARMWSALQETGHWRGEVWNVRKDGESLPVWLTVSRVDDPDSGTPASYVALMADITAVKRSEEQLHHMAHHDALTLLPNRLLLDARLQHALERARREGTRVGVLFLDVDRFKNLNDSLGHPAGDELLREVASRLRSCVREEDTVARIGGDEFVVVLEGVRDRHLARQAAEKLISTISGTVELERGNVALTASVGVVLYPDDGEDPTTLLKHADSAMYRAKEDGRNQYQFYTREMTAGAHDRLSLEVDMRRALDRGDQFAVYYQPLVTLNNGSMFGVEALMRWKHPERGNISPTEFIPIAEECGLIEPLGEWVLREACSQLRQWRASGLESLRVSVNVSGRQVVRPRLVDMVRAVLDENQLDAAALSLELTESVLMDDPAAAGATLERLSALGVTLSVDDFGTGYSSLSYLKRFPVTTLKIDRSFVRDAPVDASDAAICRAVIALADSLGLEVIAEGVETVEQRDFLLGARCGHAQGYLYGRPLPASEATVLLRRNFIETAAAAAGHGTANVTLFRTPGD